ncbi:MAG TPA: protein kinase [Polyangiaceae bacterium]|nr:protein kinase [Polyangiaceae bacterium]
MPQSRKCNWRSSSDGSACFCHGLVILGALVVECCFLETQVLAGRYRLNRQLGKGGMGSVWLAEHLTLNSWVAVKLMDPAIASTVEGAERFKREAQAAASLRSAHVVQVLDYGVHENTPFLVMELLQGQSLADCLEREKRLAPERALSVITQVARAIGRAHTAGIVHRDLKPDNIFLVREDDQELAKVLDFGIAKATGPQFGGTETRTGVTMGTPYYMSPEQVEGKKALDYRSDLWSLTVIACECMTGTRPFDGETYGELLLNICARPIVPPSQQGFFLPGFDEWFAKGANRDPLLRFSSAQELATSLADVVSGRVKPALLSAPQATGPQATLPMDPPGPVFTGSQVARAVTARGTTGAAVLRPHPGSPSPRKKSALLPVVVGLGFAIALALGLLALLVRSKAESPSSAQLPTAESPATVALATPVPSPVVLNPDVPPTAVSGTVNERAAAPSTEKSAPTSAPAATLSPTPPAPLSPTLPAIRTATAGTPPPQAGAVRVARCYSDPFTGQIRLAGAGRTGDSFPCQQNPFTGAYQRK